MEMSHLSKFPAPLPGASSVLHTHTARRFTSPRLFVMSNQGIPSGKLPGDKDKIMSTHLTCFQAGGFRLNLLFQPGNIGKLTNRENENLSVF